MFEIFQFFFFRYHFQYRDHDLFIIRYIRLTSAFTADSRRRTRFSFFTNSEQNRSHNDDIKNNNNEHPDILLTIIVLGV